MWSWIIDLTTFDGVMALAPLDFVLATPSISLIGLIVYRYEKAPIDEEEGSEEGSEEEEEEEEEDEETLFYGEKEEGTEKKSSETVVAG